MWNEQIAFHMKEASFTTEFCLEGNELNGGRIQYLHRPSLASQPVRKFGDENKANYFSLL